MSAISAPEAVRLGSNALALNYAGPPLADQSRRKFDLFYFLQNPNDTNPSYVQAVIYDVRTGAVLKTVQLAESAYNSHLFLTILQAPAD